MSPRPRKVSDDEVFMAAQRAMSRLGPKELTLLILSFIVSILSLGTGRTTVLQGVVHLVIFAAFLFLALVP